MKRYHSLLAGLALAVITGPALAGGIFKHATKPNPKERVPELLLTVKTDKDEHKRVLAAEELRQYDPAAFPDMMPILIDVLLNDAKPNVRAEAAQSLGKLRPVTQQAGWALEQALAKDSSMWVRLQARTALLSYHWSGYHSTMRKEEAASSQSNEPPVAGKSSGTLPTTPPGRLIPQPMLSPVPVESSAESRKVPMTPPRLELAPVSAGSKLQGPDLTPPQ